MCSGRLKCEADSDAIREVLLGQRPLRKVFTKEQRALYRDHAPEGIGLDDLAVLGPIFVLKLKWKPPDHARKLVAEMWLYPSGERIFEFSTRCLPSEAFQVAAEVRVFLNAHGVDTSGEQQTKTRQPPLSSSLRSSPAASPDGRGRSRRACAPTRTAARRAPTRG